MTTTLEYPPDRLTLDERHDQIIARLTRCLTTTKEARPAPAPVHDLLVPIAHPEFIDAPPLMLPPAV